MNPTDGGALWSAWRTRRERAAFEALVRAEAPYALDLARRLGASHADAEDALQESLLLLAREKSDDPVRVGVRAWLCRRVVLRTRMQRRAASRRRRHERAAPPPRSSGAPRADLRDEVEAALDHLDAEARRAVVLRFLHDLDYGEIAYVLGVTPNACRIRVHKALQRLRAVLGGRAPALIAAITLPVCKADAATVALAATKKAAALAGAGAAGTALKAGAAATLVAGAVTTAALLLPRDDRPPPVPPPARVARAEPAPRPPPGPPPTVPADDPAPPPAVVPRPAALAALDEHLSGARDLSAVFWDWEGVRGPVVVPEGAVERLEAAGPETAFDPATLDRNASVLSFGPGRFRLTAPIRLPAGGALEVRGAGPDATVLLGAGLVRLPEGDGRIVLRDFTFEGGPLLDAGGAAAAVVERVQVRGWGPGAAVRVAGRAWLGVRDSTFLGGWRAPAGGAALAVGGAALALLEDCRFVDLEHAVAGGDAHLRSRAHLLRGELLNGVHKKRGTPFPVERRDCVARLEPRCTVGALLAALDAYRPPAGERVTAIRAFAWEGLPDPLFEVHRIDDTGARRRVVLQGGRPVDDPGLLQSPLPESAGPRTPMHEVLRTHRWKLDPNEEASAIVEWAVQGEKGPIPTVSVLDRYGAPLANLTDSGELQR